MKLNTIVVEELMLDKDGAIYFNKAVVDADLITIIRDADDRELQMQGVHCMVTLKGYGTTMMCKETCADIFLKIVKAQYNSKIIERNFCNNHELERLANSAFEMGDSKNGTDKD